jgi:hypothetical protein
MGYRRSLSTLFLQKVNLCRAIMISVSAFTRKTLYKLLTKMGDVIYRTEKNVRWRSLYLQNDFINV